MPMNPSIAEHRVFGRPVSDHDDYDDDVVVVREATQYPSMALIGRFLLAAIFVMSGISKLTDIPGTVAHMTQAGIPYADTLAVVAGVSELLGAAALVFGLLARAGAVGLILYMIPTTLIFHAFWSVEGKERMPQMLNFMKNLGIIGGLAVVAGFGAGRLSLDHLVRRSRTR